MEISKINVLDLYKYLNNSINRVSNTKIKDYNNKINNFINIMDQNVKNRTKYDMSKIQNVIKEEFYNSEACEIIKNLTESVLSYSYNNLFIFETIIENNYLGNPKFRLCNFRNSKEIFFIKSDEEHIINNEYAIGIKLNKLREFIPNFAYIFGKYETKFHNIIYENIEGQTLLDFGANYSINLTEIDYINIIFQIIFSLYLANKKIGFIHYDLHGKNIIIKTLPEEKYIMYDFEDSDGVIHHYFIKTKYLAVIIDYGLSRMQLDNSNFIFHSVIQNDNYRGVNYKLNTPISDVYKFLLTMIQIFYDRRYKIVYQLIIDFFSKYIFNNNDLDIDKYLTLSTQKSFADFPNTGNNIEKIRYEYILLGLFDIFKDYIGKIFTTSIDTLKVTRCSVNNCKSKNEIENLQNNQFTDSEQFENLYLNYIDNKQKPNDLEIQIIFLINRLGQDLNSIRFPVVEEIEIINIENAEIVKNQLLLLLKYKKMFKLYDLKIKLINEILDYYKINNFNELLKEYSIKFPEYYTQINNLLTKLGININKIGLVSKTNIMKLHNDMKLIIKYNEN